MVCVCIRLRTHAALYQKERRATLEGREETTARSDDEMRRVSCFALRRPGACVRGRSHAKSGAGLVSATLTSLYRHSIQSFQHRISYCSACVAATRYISVDAMRLLEDTTHRPHEFLSLLANPEKRHGIACADDALRESNVVARHPQSLFDGEPSCSVS